MTKTFYCWGLSQKLAAPLTSLLARTIFPRKVTKKTTTHTVGCTNTQTRVQHGVPLATMSSHLPRIKEAK
jgi:hypothetical protein